MPAVRPIPEGYHSITPQITCRDAAKAIEFYKSVFGAKELMRMPGPGGKVMHAELQIGDSRFMVNDEMPGMTVAPTPAKLHAYFVVHLHRGCGRAVRSRDRGRSAGRHAAGEHVLGRPLRKIYRSVRAPVGTSHACGRRGARRDAAAHGRDEQARCPRRPPAHREADKLNVGTAPLSAMKSGSGASCV